MSTTTVTYLGQLDLDSACTDEVDAITTLMAADPMHDRDHKAVTEAILRDALAHAGQVDPNRVRTLIPTWVHKPMIGATYRVLRQQGRLIRDGWTVNEDRAGRNSGKPQAIYKWVSP